MRILMVGAGGVGGYFGAQLVEAGRDVTFLVRPARAAVLANGLVVRTPEGSSAIAVKTVTTEQLNEPFDLVILAVKAYGLTDAIDDFAAAVGPETIILPLLNGMRHLDLLRERFGADRVIGGLCVISAQVDPDGAVHFLYGKPSITYGEVDGSVSQRIREVDAALSGASFQPKLSENVLLDMWEKWTFLAAGAAITCLFRATVGEVVAVPDGTELALEIIHECESVAIAEGYGPRQGFMEYTIRTLTEPGSSFTASMYRDLKQGGKVEVEQILGDLLAHGRKNGLRLPYLDAATASLRIYQATLGS